MLEIMLYKLKSYLSLALCSLAPSLACAAEAPASLKLNLPQGFEASIFAKLEVMPRMMAFDSAGNLYVTSAQSDQLLMLPDNNHDGIADSTVIVSKQLNAPNGLAFVGEDLLVANQDAIVKLNKTNNTWSAPQAFISNLASGGHTLKTIKLGPDHHLYINIGSSCNVCVETDPTRATILRYTLAGQPASALAVVGRHSSLPPIWASGLRNSQGFAWHPITAEMYATNNGADMRSDSKGGMINDELPPEHINKIEAGQHYGWPYCWGQAVGKNDSIHMVQDPNFVGSDGFCASAMPPAITLTSHATPIGITFLDKTNFPVEFKQDAIVALHGSWNRQQLSGYKLVRIKFKQGKPVAAVDFATGWLKNNQAWGRPVDVAVGPDGALYVADDRTGYIYTIRYKARQ
jgi:glucose/arabinose dehydrogenase